MFVGVCMFECLCVWQGINLTVCRNGERKNNNNFKQTVSGTL